MVSEYILNGAYGMFNDPTGGELVTRLSQHMLRGVYT